MATTVTIEMQAEDLRWPKKCVCCGDLDETDIEVIVPDTVDVHRKLEEVITAEVPHCLDCRRHSAMGFTFMQITAFVLVICLSAGALAVISGGHALAIAAVGFVAILLIVGLDKARVRAAMKHHCTASGQAYKFVHPCGSAITTVLFLNDAYAREFRAVNGRGVYEP